MSDVWHVLVTGPVAGPEPWLAAAREAGWKATHLPLVRIEELDAPAWDGPEPPDWIAVTSSSALAPLVRACEARPDLREASFCCVGEATARRAQELGLPEPLVPPPGAQDAAGLARTLTADAPAGVRVLWPRGDRAAAFGQALEEAGFEVRAPVVYRTALVELTEEPPDCDAVFFASPSAVRAWRAEERAAAPAAIAIGWTTYDALDQVAHRFSMTLPLATPAPESLRDCLRSFFPSE